MPYNYVGISGSMISEIKLDLGVTARMICSRRSSDHGPLVEDTSG